jgi:hypothetical protein
MGLLAGEEIKSSRESRISYFAANGLLCLWMAVSGTGAGGIAGCLKATGDIGRKRFHKMPRETARQLAYCAGLAGEWFGSGSTH